MTAVLTPGAVFVADFPEHDPGGHEQEGPRPAILVGLPTNAGRPRFPVLVLAPVTTFRRQAWVDVPEAIHTAKLWSYGAAIRELPVLHGVEHIEVVASARCNNLVE